MKKFTLFLVAILFSALSFAALNPYAYGLSSELSLDETTLTVNYSLNAPATAVSVVIMDGENPVKTVDCTGIDKGSYTIEIPTDELPKSKSLTWKVEVKGTSVGSPTLHEEGIKKFWLPYGLDVDVDPESDYFGRWYVIEANQHDATGYESDDTQRGLYVYDAALKPILNNNNKKGFSGGINVGALTSDKNSSGHMLNFYRVVTSGGRVFIGRFRAGDSYAPIVEVDPSNLDATFTDVYKSGEAVSIDAFGRGKDLKLVMLTKDKKIYEYDLGTDKSIANASRSINYTEITIARTDATITYDKSGNIWLNQHLVTATAEEPTIAHISIADGIDYNNVLAGLSHNGTENCGIAVSPDGKLLAVVGAGTKKITIYEIENTAGNISLSSKYTISTAGTRHTALAWDYAGNLYAGNRGSEDIRHYAIPYSGTVSTPCASKYAFELKEVYTLTTNVVGEGTIEGSEGSYVEGTTATLTATPKPGYKLLAWSNKATTPSITLTMDNNKAVSAYFVKEYATDPTFTIEKVWENTINIPGTGNGYQAVGWDGKIYMQDAGNKKIQVFSSSTDAYVEYATSGAGQQIAVDEAGNLIVLNHTFYNDPTNVLIYQNGNTTGKEVSFVLPNTGRCDFFTASGDIYSAEGGYIYFYCSGTTVVNRLKITNGAATAADVTTDVICANLPSAGTQSNVVVDIFGNIHVESKNKPAGVYNITNLAVTNDTHLGSASKSTPTSTIGGCTFELGGKEWWAYLAGTTNYSSEWQLYNETDGSFLSNELYLTATKTTVGATANWLNAQVVDEKTAYIYQFCPKVGAAVWKVTMKENYLVSATATNGIVSGAGTYQEGATATLTATPNTGYKFVNWTKDGVEVSTEATYSFPVTENVELVANFEAITSKSPRAWAYGMKLGEDGDNYTFTFNATTAGQATITFKDGHPLTQPASQIMAAIAGKNKFTIAKNAFAAGVDAFWSITIDGAPIEGVVEVTDQSRGIYDFYNMQGVVVDNNTDSKDFGKIYVQASLNGKTDGRTDRADNQTAGIFIYNQELHELNTPSNVGIKPTMPAGYTEIGSSSYAFQRLNIHPKTGNLVFSHAIEGKPSVFAINRDDMTGAVTNLLTGVADMTRSVAHCFDAEGTLYVMDFAGSKGAIYKVVNGEATKFTETSSRFINANITIASDGRGGFWVSQNRGQIDYYYQLVHVTSEGAIDWSIYDDLGTYVAAKDDNPGKLGTSSLGWLGSSSRGALAYDAERNILAQGRNGKVELYTVSYDPTITLTPLHTIVSNDLGTNIDGLAFDYAGDLYVVNSSKEKFQKFTLPTPENICTVAAPSLEAIRFTPVYTVSVESNNNEWGIVSGGGTFEEGQNATITAVAATNYKFVNWTKDGAEVSTENPYTFAVTETATYTANFVEITKYTINATANDGEMGSVTGGGDYYEGSTATLTAIPVGGYVFEKWSDDNTDNPRTITVNGAAAYTAIFKVAPARVFAYNLDVVDNGDDTYTLSFIPNANATSGRVILYNDDTKAQIHEAPIAGTIAKGVKSEVVVSKSVMPATGIVTWAVELTGETVEQLTLLSDPTKKDIYGFNRPQGVAIDNNPASDYFGRMYIALPKAGGTYYTDKNYGIVVMDPLHNRLKSGVVSNGDALGEDGRYSMHRVAVNPTNGHVYYVRTSDSNEGVTGTAIYELAPDATNILTDGGTAKNVINGISEITNANSVCFDENGVMYVVANANYVDGASTGRVYKVVDGVATLVTQSSREIASKDNAIVPDGKGGFWIAQHRNNLDGFNHLLHINSSGVADYTISKDENASLLPVQTYVSKEDGKTYNNASYRGQVAYYSIDENNGLVAYGGGAKVSVFKATYDGSGVPTLTTWQTISLLSSSSTAGIHVDGIAFDYAGNIVVMSATDERMYQYALPIETANTSLVPSPTSKAIKLGTIYTVEVTVNDPAMGAATGGGEYLEGETVTVTATANTGYRFVNWTKNAEEVSTSASFDYTVPAEDVTLTANFEPLPEITYELNGGVWNAYGWTNKKDMYNALLDDWRTYSGYTRTNVSYEEQLGIGNSSKGIPTTIAEVDHRVALMDLFTDATYAPKWRWLANYVDAVAATQYKKMDAANGPKTQPTSGAGVLTYTIGNFFGEDNVHSTDYIDAVDFTGVEAHITAFAPYWGQTFPMPTQPTEEVVLNAPYKEGYEFSGWYTTSDFSGAAVTTVDENTDATLYAKWIETIINVTIDEKANNTAALAPYEGKTVTAIVTRNFGANKILTLTLPFDMSATQISTYFGNATVYEFYNVVNAGEELHLQLSRTNAIEAGKPYILQTTSGYDAEDGFTIEDVIINTELTSVKIGELTMVPVLNGGGTLNQPTQYYLSNNALYCAGDYNQPLPGLRAFFTSASPTPLRARVIFEDNEATSIPVVSAPENKAQKIIKDGRLIIIRGEHQYNAQGQVIE